MTDDGKFEVGDTVICIKAPGIGKYPLEVGTVLTIARVDFGTLKRINPTSASECFRVELFKLYQPFGTHKILKRGIHAVYPDL